MSAVATPALPVTTRPRPWRWTREEYFRLGELGFFYGKHVERIRGEIIEMSPPGWPHTLAKTKTADVLRQVFAGIGWVNEQSPFPTPDSDPQPDVAVYTGKAEYYTDHPTDPLLIVEVSDTTLFHDTTTKAELYAEAGVQDYWVLDLENRRLLVYRTPRAITAGGHTYQSHKEYALDDVLAPLAAPTASVKVADLLP